MKMRGSYDQFKDRVGRKDLTVSPSVFSGDENLWEDGIEMTDLQ